MRTNVFRNFSLFGDMGEGARKETVWNRLPRKSLLGVSGIFVFRGIISVITLMRQQDPESRIELLLCHSFCHAVPSCRKRRARTHSNQRALLRYRQRAASVVNDIRSPSSARRRMMIAPHRWPSNQ